MVGDPATVALGHLTVEIVIDVRQFTRLCRDFAGRYRTLPDFAEGDHVVPVVSDPACSTAAARQNGSCGEREVNSRVRTEEDGNL